MDSIDSIWNCDPLWMSLYLGPTPPTTSSQVSCPITLRLWLVFSSADFHTPTPFIYNSNKHVKIAIHSLYVQIKFLLSKLLWRYMLSQMSYNSLRAGAKCLTRVPLSRTRAQCKARSGCTCAELYPTLAQEAWNEKVLALCFEDFWLLFLYFRTLNHKMTWKRKSSIDSFLRYGNPEC